MSHSTMNLNFEPGEIDRFRALWAHIQQGGAMPNIGTPAPVVPAGAPPLAMSSGPPHSAVPLPAPALPPPITQIYQPSTRRSMPNLSQISGHPQSTPFLPFITPNIATTSANQARMASASLAPNSRQSRNQANLPRRVSQRGPASQPPTLRPRKPSVEMCHGTDITGAPVLRILVKVLPPPPDVSSILTKMPIVLMK